MSWTDRFNNPGYKNWLRVGIALLATRDGLTNVTLQAATKLHGELKAKLGDSVENCTCNPKKGQECEDCKPWREELKTKYYTGDASRIGWTNCTPSKWSKEPWEVAKVFMPKDPTADNTGPEKSDPSALLNFLIHCTYCKKYVSVKPSQKVIEVRNKAMHSKDLTFNHQTFNEHMGKMDRMLRLVKDPLTLAADITAQEAADKVLKIKKGEFHIGAKLNKDCLDAEVRVLRESMREQKKLVELHKEQLEDHETRLDTLEKSIPPVEEIQQMVGAVLDIINNNADLQSSLKDQAMALSTIAQQLQDRLDKVEGAVGQLEETVAEHGAQISDVQQKLHQLEAPSGSTRFSPVMARTPATLLQKMSIGAGRLIGQAFFLLSLAAHALSGTDDQKKAFTSALAVKYSNTLKTLKPLPWNNKFHVELDQIFTRLELVGRRGNEDKSEGITFESLDDVFDHQPESDVSKRFNVLVVGDAGSGKSTLFSKTALDWSCKKGRLVDLNKIVLLIRLREVQLGESIAEIVWDQCVTKSAHGISISSIETCLQYYESDVVFLLDGYDELVPDAKGPKQAVPELLAKTWYPDCTVIVTSRPFPDIERYMAVDREVKVIGFSSDHVDEYVPLYFQCVENPDLADPLVKALKSKANIVARGLIQTPMFLVLICVLWEDNPTIVHFPVTMSGLYRELLTCVIKKYCVREGMSIPNDKIPPVVLNALHHLGKLALESLLRGESLVDLGKTTVNQDTDVMVNLGIVSKEVSASRLHPRQQLNFPHKSMQEFLAARYVADRVNTSSDDLHSLVPLDTVLQQKNLVQFICGCGGKVTGELLASLNTLYVAEKDNNALKYLCLISLYEGHDSQHFPKLSSVLSSLNLEIKIPSRKGAALKFYLDHATAVPEDKSLNLLLEEDSKGDAVEYLSSLVEKTIPDLDLRLYLSCTQYEDSGVEEVAFCHIGNKLGKLIPKFLTNVPNMRSLNLAYTSLTPESIQALRQILPKLTMLEELDLSGNPDIGDNEIDLLSKGLESNVRLRNVNFSKVGLGDVAGKSIASVLHYLSCLKTLDLSDNNIGDEGKEPFAAIQQPVASLKVLDLSYNKIGDVCLGSLAAVLHHLSCLKYLYLSHNNIGDEGKEPFAAIQQPVVSLKVLDLSYNKIGDVCLGSLVAVVHQLSCLENLYLSYNNIGDEGKEPFAAIQHPVVSLKTLHLSHNKIGDICLGSLVAMLHYRYLSCLEYLNLSHNKIGDAEIASLAATLHHVPTLECVFLDDNPVTAVGLQRFAQTIHSMPALKELSLDTQQTVHLDDTAAMSICTMLTQLPVLELLRLRNISMQAAGLQAVATAVEEHPTLQNLWYSEECVPQGVNIRSLSSKIDM